MLFLPNPHSTPISPELFDDRARANLQHSANAAYKVVLSKAMINPLLLNCPFFHQRWVHVTVTGDGLPFSLEFGFTQSEESCTLGTQTWRGMFLTSPPATTVVVRGRPRAQRAYGWSYNSFGLRHESGITLGALADVLDSASSSSQDMDPDYRISFSESIKLHA